MDRVKAGRSIARGKEATAPKMPHRLIFTWTISTQVQSGGAKRIPHGDTHTHTPFVLADAACDTRDLQTYATFKVFGNQANNNNKKGIKRKYKSK